jgi:hypothetical protein
MVNPVMSSLLTVTGNHSMLAILNASLNDTRSKLFNDHVFSTLSSTNLLGSMLDESASMLIDRDYTEALMGDDPNANSSLLLCETLDSTSKSELLFAFIHNFLSLHFVFCAK